MTNFNPDLNKIIPSQLVIKASGSIIEQINNDLKLPDGKDIQDLLKNEEKNSLR